MIHYREQWLRDSVHLLGERLFKPKGFTVPEKIRISMGFPKGARGGGSGSIGQCWPMEASADGHAEIFVHPAIAEPTEVLAIVTHELVHTINHAAGLSGHGKAFKDIAVGVGLTGKMTATTAGEDLSHTLAAYAGELGPLPHASMVFGEGKAKGKQGTRMLKVVCDCGYTVRTTQKWVDVGIPVCPCGRDMHLDAGDEE